MKENPEKTKLMAEVFGKRRSSPSIYQDALDVLDKSDSAFH